jgi:glycine cleavage system H protein
MSIPPDLKYTKSHEWVRVESDGTITVGITHHAQDLLGDMVFVENPAVGRNLNAGEECAVVESVKAASDVYAPVAGEVVASNSEVESSPWLFKIRPANTADVNALMDAAKYEAQLVSESH